MVATKNISDLNLTKFSTIPINSMFLFISRIFFVEFGSIVPTLVPRDNETNSGNRDGLWTLDFNNKQVTPQSHDV